MSKRKLSVMVVDDSRVVLERLRYVLENAGHEVTVRDSSLGTVAAVLKLRPDVLVLDVSMPALAGDRLAAVIGDMGHDTIIILHSSRPEAELRELADACGAHGVIPKSHDLKGFMLRFDTIVQRASSSKLRAASPR